MAKPRRCPKCGYEGVKTVSHMNYPYRHNSRGVTRIRGYRCAKKGCSWRIKV